MNFKLGWAKMKLIISPTLLCSFKIEIFINNVSKHSENELE